MTGLPRKEELDSPAGQIAKLAALVVRRMADRPGIWDFLEEFKPRLRIIELESRLAETLRAQSAEVAQESKRLYLVNRALELRKALDAAKLEEHEREHPSR